MLCGVHAGSLYSKNSAVTQITGLDYDRVIAKSNYTSVRSSSFYAPWCGHCQNLKPAYESAAKSLAGIAKVAAVNCDDEANKPFCGQMGVQGFPTLKIIRPGKKPGKPTIEDYQGPRQAKAIVDAVKDKIPNKVKRITDKNLDEWLEEDKDSPKAILFSDKGLTSATLKTLAIDFAGLISIAQIRNKEKAAVERFGVEKVPTLILLPGDSKDPITYEGEMKKEAMVEFLSQIAPPNPDCPPEKPKNRRHQKPVVPTESPDPNVKVEDAAEPIIIPEEEPKPTIPIIDKSSELQALCLNDRSTTCILAILPKDESSEVATSAIASLASIHKKHDARAGHLFPFIGVPAPNPLASQILSELKLGTENEVHLIATNAKRGWWKKYPGQTFGTIEVEQWVDAIRMSEGKKENLPNSLVTSQEKAEAKEEKPTEQEPLKIVVEEIPDEQETPEPSEQKHDEL
ncbi:protein disulfide-isomerase MPD1 precursor [Lojkania enalia]|uniref:protein disulfide-isomerase n=1 Tax=Lojkania enalia TaxID=147567 RepID=A0A9P4KDW6_9PLEO|nr:protein disulfide-isomerase MPD1 precursor [Didymosphaeria enalia]